MFQFPIPIRFGTPPQARGSSSAKRSPDTWGTHSGADVSTSSGCTRVSRVRAKARANSSDSGPPVRSTASPRAGTMTAAKSKNGQKPARYLDVLDSHSLL